MDTGEREKLILRLELKLREVEARFDGEARKRGFDPAQAENMALPATLATLFTECEEIKSQLEELAKDKRRD